MASRCIVFVSLRRIPREGFEALLAARRLGYDVCYVGAGLPAVAEPLVREALTVDTYDHDAVLGAIRTLAGRHDVRGVANFTEVDIAVVARAADELGLPGLPLQAVRRARNKWDMKSALAGAADLLPAFARVLDAADLRAAIERIGLPAVVKPTGASGSKGIFELHHEADVEPAMAHLSRIARPDYDRVFHQYGAEFIVEEFVGGDEVSVEGFVQDGRVTVVAVTDKVTSKPFHLELLHVVPSALPGGTIARVTAATERIVAALEFDHCAFHLEGKVDGKRFTFIEIAARPAGDYIASHLVPLATGVDYFANVIRVAAGEALVTEPDRSEHAGLQFLLADRPGRFEGLARTEALLERAGYDHVFLEVPVGGLVRLPPEHFTSQRVAAVCARHGDRPSLDRLLAEAEKTVEIHIAGDG